MSPLHACTILWLAWAAYWALAARGAAPSETGESRRQRLGHLLPTAAAVGLLLWPAPPGPLAAIWLEGPRRWAGLPVTALGLAFSVWARATLGRSWAAGVSLQRGHELARCGPYRLVRHPIYLGMVIAFLGTGAAGGMVSGLAAAATVSALLWRKARREDALLAARFGADYERYRSG